MIHLLQPGDILTLIGGEYWENVEKSMNGIFIAIANPLHGDLITNRSLNHLFNQLTIHA